MKKIPKIMFGGSKKKPVVLFSKFLRGSASSDPESAEVKRLQRLREEVMMLKREETNLDRSFEMAQNVLRTMSEDEYNKRLSYLTHTDIRTIPVFSDETLLAVKAPYGSTLEVPDPDEVNKKNF